MKGLSIICGVTLLLSLMAVPAFPLSYEFDFNHDGVWDTEWQLEEGETVAVEIWLDGYLEDELFGVTLYFQYDPSKIKVNQVIPHDTAHGGPFTPSWNKILEQEDGVYELSVANFDSVPISNNSISFFEIELECIVDEADIAIKAANDLGFGGYNRGVVAYYKNNTMSYVYPDDAVCEPTTTTSSTTTSTSPPLPTTTSTLSPTSSSSSSTTTSTITPTQCTSDGECDDGMFCNGEETCVDNFCQAGDPVVCDDDGLFCTGKEMCDETTEACVSSGDPCAGGQACDEESDACFYPASPLEFSLIPDSALRSHLIPLPLFMFIVSDDSGTEFDRSVEVSFSSDELKSLGKLVLSKKVIFTLVLIRPSGVGVTGSTEVSVTVTKTSTEEEGTIPFTLNMLPFILDQEKDSR